jgi:hypothetical protein
MARQVTITATLEVLEDRDGEKLKAHLAAEAGVIRLLSFTVADVGTRKSGRHGPSETAVVRGARETA